ncbi:Glucan endo-1,3-beta-glucosidase [Spatholobus suberectus]|nr:Glucan endo-1,3-beta-glucosidase [Spatholobus suberectus]
MSAIFLLVGILSSITDEEALQALRGSGIELLMDVAKETLQSLTNSIAATNWVNKYVTPYSQDVNFKYIIVGNEIHPSDIEAQYILSAMTNMQNAISSANLQIKVSTAIDTGDADPYIRLIINFLVNNGALLLANVYPYFAYANDQQSISLAYALFTQQGNNDVGYQNLFDAMLDSIYIALEKMGSSNLQIVVSESGWPSEGGDGATTNNASTYYANLISHASSGSGTPKRPGGSIETFLFAMFDENQKSGEPLSSLPDGKRETLEGTAMSAILLLVGILSSITGAQSLGICYGVNGGNLPSRQEVVDLYKNRSIGGMRIYYPDEEALQALKGSGLELIMDVAGETLQSLTDPNAATEWVNKYMTPYSQDVNFKYIAIGNEIHPGDNDAQYILSAMTNIQNAISSANLQVKVSTAIDTSLITNSYPPDNGVFTGNADLYIRPIINFLVNNGAPLLANVYPYFTYANDQQSISLAYALFSQQGNNDAGYQNLFDAMLDSIYAALEKVGASNLQIVVSESGWPSDGGDGATSQNAYTYYANLINHTMGGSGTPKRPGGPIETYLFALFDENQKPGVETERHFGLFNPNKSPKYHPPV